MRIDAPGGRLPHGMDTPSLHAYLLEDCRSHADEGDDHHGLDKGEHCVALGLGALLRRKRRRHHHRGWRMELVAGNLSLQTRGLACGPALPDASGANRGCGCCIPAWSGSQSNRIAVQTACKHNNDLMQF